MVMEGSNHKTRFAAKGQSCSDANARDPKPNLTHVQARDLAVPRPKGSLQQKSRPTPQTLRLQIV